MTLSAYLPFFRNHNILSAIPQEPYVWDSVADASRDNIAVRYSLLPYWVSLQGGRKPVSHVSERLFVSNQVYAVCGRFKIRNSPHQGSVL